MIEHDKKDSPLHEYKDEALPKVVNTNETDHDYRRELSFPVAATG